MPSKISKKSTRRFRKRSTRVPRRRHVFNTADRAAVTSYATQTPPGSGSDFSVNQMYSKTDFQLADHERAVSVGRAYQLYRMTGVKLTVKPNIDTFTAGGGYQKMNLYYMINKNGSIPANVTLEALKRAGAKPIALDEKPITIRWKPAVRTVVSDAVDPIVTSPSQFKISPWLSTNERIDSTGTWSPSRVDHGGILFYVEQQGSAASYKVDLEVNFEFKKPLWGDNVSATLAATFGNCKLDDSPDGIAETPDT